MFWVFHEKVKKTSPYILLFPRPTPAQSSEWDPTALGHSSHLPQRVQPSPPRFHSSPCCISAVLSVLVSLEAGPALLYLCLFRWTMLWGRGLVLISTICFHSTGIQYSLTYLQKRIVHLYWVPRRYLSVCKPLFMLSLCILTSIQCNETIAISILQMQRLRLREVKPVVT